MTKANGAARRTRRHQGSRTETRATSVAGHGEEYERTFRSREAAWRWIDRMCDDGLAVAGRVEQRIVGGPFRPRWQEVA